MAQPLVLPSFRARISPRTKPLGGKTLFTQAEGSSAEVVELKIFVGLEETAKAKDYKPNMLQVRALRV